MRPINVLHLRDTTEVGGPGKTILETHRAIDGKSFSLHLGVFLTRDESGETPFVAAAREFRLPVHFIRGHNQYDPRLITRVAALVRRLEIDVLHTHEVKSDVIGWLVSRLCRVPVVTTLHGWIGNSLKQRLFIQLDRRVVRHFDRVIAVSSQIRNELLAAGVDAAKIALLHNAIVLERYRRGPRAGYLESVFGRRVEPPVILSLGRISREKGHADLVDALAIVASKGHRVPTVIAGDGPDRAQLVQKIRSLGLSESIQLPGYISQPQVVLNECDLLVLPSHTEGLPNAALEALAMGVPVLATAVGGTPEIIVDGETGRLVPPRSPAALAHAILEFLSDPEPWKRMAGSGRTVVEARFGFAARTRKLEGIYADLLREPVRA